MTPSPSMRRTVILFAKEPRAGTAKTRLTPPLTAVEAAEVAAAFYKDSVALLERVVAGRKVVGFAPRTAGEALRSLAGEGFEFLPQREGDLGERMRAAFDEAFSAGAERVVIIGADTPTLPARFVEEAFEALETKDVAVGPSTDLGYYLIGLGRSLPALFRAVEWSTVDVLPRTLAIVAAEKLALHLLPVWYDIDTPAELEVLRHQIEGLRLMGADEFPRHSAEVLGRYFSKETRP